MANDGSAGGPARPDIAALRAQLEEEYRRALSAIGTEARKAQLAVPGTGNLLGQLDDVERFIAQVARGKSFRELKTDPQYNDLNRKRAELAAAYGQTVARMDLERFPPDLQAMVMRARSLQRKLESDDSELTEEQAGPTTTVAWRPDLWKEPEEEETAERPLLHKLLVVLVALFAIAVVLHLMTYRRHERDAAAPGPRRAMDRVQATQRTYAIYTRPYGVPAAETRVSETAPADLPLPKPQEGAITLGSSTFREGTAFALEESEAKDAVTYTYEGEGDPPEAQIKHFLRHSIRFTVAGEPHDGIGTAVIAIREPLALAGRVPAAFLPPDLITVPFDEAPRDVRLLGAVTVAVPATPLPEGNSEYVVEYSKIESEDGVFEFETGETHPFQPEIEALSNAVVKPSGPLTDAP